VYAAPPLPAGIVVMTGMTGATYTGVVSGMAVVAADDVPVCKVVGLVVE